MKRLELNRETLRELTPKELKAAGGAELTPVIQTLPLNDCVVSLNASCIAADCITPAP